MMTQKKPSLRWLWITLIVAVPVIYFRSYLPIVFFKYAPYAEIDAVIPPDMKLWVGAGYSSSACTQITFSDFGQVRGSNSWSKEYTPDKQGRVKAKVYRSVLGPCNWLLTDFGIVTVYKEIPEKVLTTSGISDEIKEKIKANFLKSSNYSHRSASLDFSLSGISEKENDISQVKLKTILTPSVIKELSGYGTTYYSFSYDDKKRVFDGPHDTSKLPWSRKGESLKIEYRVEADNRILYEEVYPDDIGNNSRYLE